MKQLKIKSPIDILPQLKIVYEHLENDCNWVAKIKLEQLLSLIEEAGDKK